MTTIQSKTSIDVMLRLSASNTSSATICVARPKNITVSFKESKAAQYKHSNVTGTCEKRNVFLGEFPAVYPLFGYNETYPGGDDAIRHTYSG